MDGPILIVGTMRSGSTLLRLLLDSHPAIAIGGETNFLTAAAATEAIPGWKYGREWYGRLGWSQAELDERIRGFYSGMFERYAASQGKRRWGDKTPAHVWQMALAARLFPEAVFVGIVRHPGAVAASLRTRFHYSWEGALDLWRDTNVELVRQAALLGDRVVLCRYEDLVATPEAVLRELLGWLGEPWADEVLEHHDVQREKGAPRLVDGDTSPRDAIDASRAGRWAVGLDAQQRATLEGRAGALARFFGYDVLDAAGPAALREGDGGLEHLVTGTELRARAARRSSELDLSPPALAADPDASLEELVARAARAEATLARVRDRPVVRLSDALRRAQRGRSVEDVRAVVRTLRGTRRGR